MNENDKRLTFKRQIYEETFLKNPVLISVIGLCPVVAITTTLKSALILSGITFLILIIAELFSASIFKAVPQWIRIGLYTLTGMLVVSPVMFLLEKFSVETMLALGIYLPLMAVNPLIVRQCERDAVNASLKEALKSAFSVSVAYSVVLIFVGLLREVFGRGEIWGYRIFSTPVASLTMPFGGFLIIGFMAAFLRWYIKKKDPEYEQELAFNSRIATKKKKPAKGQNDILNDAIELLPFMEKKPAVKEEIKIVEVDKEIQPEPSEPVPAVIADVQSGEQQNKPTEISQEPVSTPPAEMTAEKAVEKTLADMSEALPAAAASVPQYTTEDTAHTVNDAEKDTAKAPLPEEIQFPDKANAAFGMMEAAKEPAEPEKIIRESEKAAKTVKKPNVIEAVKESAPDFSKASAPDLEKTLDFIQEPEPEEVKLTNVAYDPENIINEMLSDIKSEKSGKKQKPKKSVEEDVALKKSAPSNRPKKSNAIEYSSKELEEMMSKSLDDLITGLHDEKTKKDKADKGVPLK